MKARRVKGVDPSAAMADGLELVVRTRLDELFTLAPAAQDPADARALHDLRIAAKRLRYVLEVAAKPCFGPYAAEATARAKALQSLLGELHDCDVALPRVRALQAQLRAADVLEARARAGDARDLEPVHASGTPHAQDWRGLEALRIHFQARRGLLFERFLEAWRDLERDGFRARLQYALSERPAFTSRSPRDAPAQRGSTA